MVKTVKPFPAVQRLQKDQKFAKACGCPLAMFGLGATAGSYRNMKYRVTGVPKVPGR